jgi:hypothetical protein
MSQRLLPIALVSLLIMTVWLFLGIEETPREHRTDYEFFTKQMPSFQVIYRNPAVCGECDVEPFSTLSPETLEKLSGFCRIRFGLDNVRACYAVFEETQRMATERQARP